MNRRGRIRTYVLFTVLLYRQLQSTSLPPADARQRSGTTYSATPRYRETSLQGFAAAQLEIEKLFPV